MMAELSSFIGSHSKQLVHLKCKIKKMIKKNLLSKQVNDKDTGTSFFFFFCQIRHIITGWLQER